MKTKTVKIRYQYNIVREYEIPEDCLENEKNVFESIKHKPEDFLFYGQNLTGDQKVSVSLVVLDPKTNVWAKPKEEKLIIIEDAPAQPITEAKNDQGCKS